MRLFSDSLPLYGLIIQELLTDSEKGLLWTEEQEEKRVGWQKQHEAKQN